VALRRGTIGRRWGGGDDQDGGGSGGSGGEDLTAYLKFRADLSSSLNPQLTHGDPLPSFARDTAKAHQDQDGKWRQAVANEAVFDGSRAVTNLITASEDMTNGLYTTTTGATVDSGTQFTTDGTANARVSQVVTITDDGSGAGGRAFTFSVWLKLISGDAGSGAETRISIGGNAIAQSTLNVGANLSTTESKRFSITLFTDAAGTQVQPDVRSSNAITLEATKWQLEEVTGQLNQNPGEYVSTGVGTGSEQSPQVLLDSDETGSWSDFSDSFTFDTDHYNIQRTDTDGRAFRSIPTAPVVGKDYVIEVEAAAASGTEVINVGPTNSGGTDQTFLVAYTATTTRTTFRMSFTATADTTDVALWNDGASSNVNYYSVSIKEADHGANRDGVKYFPYHNGNTKAIRKFLDLDGTGDYASSPDSSAASITGDISLPVYVRANDYSNGVQTLISKYITGTDQRSFRVDITGSQEIDVYISTLGTAVSTPQATSSTLSGVWTDGEGIWLMPQVDVSASTCTVKYSFDPPDTEYSDITWTTHEADIAFSASIAAGIFDSTSPVELGSINLGTGNELAGKIFRAAVISGLDETATPALDFNAEDHTGGIGLGTGVTELYTSADAVSTTNESDTKLALGPHTALMPLSHSVANTDTEGGSYALEIDANGFNSARGALDLDTEFSLVDGREYKLTMRYKLVSGGDADIYLATTNSGTDNTVATVSSSDWTEVTYTFVHGSDTNFLTIKENSGSNDSVVHVSSVSIKEAYLWNFNGDAFIDNEETGVVTEAQGPAINSSTSQRMFLDGVAGTYASTPDNASFPTSDATFVAWASLTDISVSGTFLSKQAGAGDRSVLFDLNSGNMRLVIYDDGTNSDVSSVSVSSLTSGVGYWFRATVNFTTQKVDFYTSTQPLGTSLDAINWVQLGTQQSTGGTGIFNSDTIIEIGSSGGAGGGSLIDGSIARVAVIDGTDPTADPVVDFNANDYVSGETFETPYSTADPLVNGGFDADSDWTLDDAGGGGSQTISGGQLTLTQGGSSVWMASVQAIDVSGVSTVRLEGTMVSSTTAGNKRIGINSTSSANGTPNLGWVGTTNTTETDLSVVIDVSAYDTVYVQAVDGQAALASAVFDDLTATPTGGTLWTLNGQAKIFGPTAKWVNHTDTVGQYISTPDSAAVSPTDGVATAFFGALGWQTYVGDETLSGKFNSGQGVFLLRRLATGYLRADLSSTASSELSEDSTVPVNFQDDAIGGIMMVFDNSAETVTFYESYDDPWTPWDQITWTQLGDVITGVALSGPGLIDTASPWQIGAYSAGGVNGVMNGNAMRGAIWKDGDYTSTPDAEFDARKFVAGETTAVMPDGATYTLNGTVTVGENIPAPFNASGPKGYSDHEARTNHLQYSNGLDSWTKATGGTGLTPTVTANGGIAPDGSKTAFRLQADLNGGTASADISWATADAVSMSNPHDSAASVWLKSNTGADQNVTFYTANGAGQHVVTVTSYWQRFEKIVESVAATTEDFAVGLRGGQTADDTCDILVWEGQVEDGTFITPNINVPSTTPITRDTDSLEYDATGNALTSAGTIRVDHTPSSEVPSGTNFTIFSVDDGSAASDSVFSRIESDDETSVNVYSGTSLVANMATGVATIPGVTETNAIAYQVDDFELYMNGASKDTDTSGAAPTGDFTTIRIGNSAAGTQPYNGNISGFEIYSKRGNDTEVAAL
jgi:hypothetical protein